MTFSEIRDFTRAIFRREMTYQEFEQAVVDYMLGQGDFRDDLVAFRGDLMAFSAWLETWNNVYSASFASSSLNANSLLVRASNTILGAGDVNKTVIATVPFTQTLTAAATLGNSWFCFVRNNSSGSMTIDPFGTELISGQSSYTLTPGMYVMVFCDGTSFGVVVITGDTSRNATKRALRKVRNYNFIKG